ncbi:MAG: Verru_Chthon cassette protein A [Verrucomicrobia bacterium]|nr:Verru_Chthon cassette protein A [Verrucomicrobiota bacterium]
MIKIKSRSFASCEQRGVALVIVLSLIAVMTLLAVTFFVSVSGEGKSSQHQSDGAKAGQLATSAAQMVMAQIQAASTATPAGAGAGVAWTSQPGLLRTFPSSGPSKVFKLYSAPTMVTDSFQETDDAPPADWKQSPALYSDINAPARVSSGTGLVYPVADPGAAGVVPGFTLGSAPGFSGGSPSPGNNPLPMPVRWLYILKNGEMAVPDSFGADGTVNFAPTSAQPASDNPVIGRVAFWADDETCKVNVNTAGYAKNDAPYWSFWDTPTSGTSDEWSYLAGAQPWTNEFQRYPGHPATTDMSLVFAPLSLTDDQVLSLSPFYKAGGTRGGTVQVTSPATVASDVPTQAQIRGLLKSQRLFASVDELFYSVLYNPDPNDPKRGINTMGISWQNLEARRFLLTTSSRAPETTLFDTPRVTIWPAWRTESKRTPIERLIAFCSTIAPGSSNPQNFYFVRENSLSDRELLDFPENLKLWNYLRTLAGRPLPVLGASIVSKYTGSTTDQILTSVFDAIRLANLDDRSGPADGQTTGYSFTRGELKKSGSYWTLKDPMAGTIGFVAPTKGPNNTFSPGRAACLQEVAISFVRYGADNDTTKDSNGVRAKDKAQAMMLYCFSVPTPGSIAPGQDMRIAVSGLSGFRYVTANGTEKQIFPNDTFNNMQTDRGNPAQSLRGFGRPEWTMSAQTTDPAKGAPATGGLKVFVPLTGEMVLPINDADPTWMNKTFTLKGTPVTIALYSPASAPTPLRTYQVTFPDAQVLTPLFGGIPSLTDQFNINTALGTPPTYSIYGDSLLAMQSPTTDPRYDALQTGTITNFVPHARYGKTDVVGMPPGSEWQSTAWSRRASFFPLPTGGDAPPLVLGQLIEGGPTINITKAPLVASAPAGANGQSIQKAFPPGDFSNGVGFNRAGGWGAKSDEGSPIWGGNDGQTWPPHPYFQSEISGAEGSEGMLSSPNRQMPSAVLFGSICSGAPWRTLLFRPARSYLSGGSSHFGNQSPPDWAILDFFHMPVAEPYAISEPFATAGKVNLNARIIPFSSYLTRETALRAVLASVRLTAIPSTLAPVPTFALPLPDIKTRYPLDPEETLRSVRDRLNGTDGSGRSVFLSAGEVCSMDLVPQGTTRAGLATWWADKSKLTGDNSLESPYATLVPRLTARSNTFTVHVTAQSLAPGPGVVGWREGRGRVTAEWRGAISVERYVDPNDSRFTGPSAPNFLSGTQPVGPYYRFRVLGTRRFNP